MSVSLKRRLKQAEDIANQQKAVQNAPNCIKKMGEMIAYAKGQKTIPIDATPEFLENIAEVRAALSEMDKAY
jgi:hypothetical protein